MFLHIVRIEDSPQIKNICIFNYCAQIRNLFSY
jgi:hypothetical protein